ncbi:MAG: SecD/SecF fusion protein [Gaiellaceae bacterium]|jgi:SecD/SecF fusion protein|nr:SecD/SecF fusion protein [Gaiellaceae bacterium]
MSETRKHLLLVALIAAALVGAALLIVPGSPVHKPVKQGLDLQGGLEVVLKASAPRNHPLTKSDLDRSIEIMRSRVDKLGVSEPEIRKQGSNQIVIELPGIKNAAQAAEVIGKTAQLELYDLETSVAGPSKSAGGIVARPSLYALLAGIQSTSQGDKAGAWYLFDAKKKLVAGPSPSRNALVERAAKLAAQAGPKVKAAAKGKDTLPGGYTLFARPKLTTVVFCGPVDRFCPGVNEAPPLQTYFYLFKKNIDQVPPPAEPVPQMTGNDLKLNGTRADIDTQTNGPEVLMSFTDKGSKKFQQITRDEYQRGNITRDAAGNKIAQHFAIVLDNEIKSWPQIDPDDRGLSNGISGGGRITGIDSLKEAKDIALVLQTGALPVKFVTAEHTEVSATLGKDSLAQAKRAALVGLLIVALFLLLLYRFLGLVAVIGLAIYAAFLYAAILILNVTLTLPGFAGLILTIGVAADANVVVFERIKEEVRAGKSVRAAIAAGYSKGFHTILDANVVTCITALILFAVATAGVKGFALMLLIGTVISLLTAVAATRAMLGLLAGFRWFSNPRFMGAQGQQTAKWLQIDFMRRRYLWLGIAAAAVVISFGSVATKGLNLGIDFKGGTQLTFKTRQPQLVDDVRAEAAKVGQRGALIQGRGVKTGERYKSFQLRTRSLQSGQLQTLQSDLRERLGAYAPGVKNVSASFGRQIAKSALMAIFFSLFLIVGYIAIRFDLKFALPVIVALLHDIALTVGVYSLLGREVTTSTVAAVLTVLGYSIYDTIIIFDRVRENVPLMRGKASYATIANVSLWETIRRSLATTFITLLPVGSLLVFGGATLKDFAFALMVGIASGAYSSIFIAAPLLTMLKEREPEWARRKALDLPADGDGRGGVDAGTAALEQAESAAAAEPAPELIPTAAATSADAKREQRRQRRRTRPHGRAR